MVPERIDALDSDGRSRRYHEPMTAMGSWLMSRVPGWYALLCIAVSLTACSGTGSGSPGDTSADDGPAPTQSLPVVENFAENHDLPEEQLGYFQDGKVTLQEYQEAYGAFVQCAADAGIGDDLREQSRDEVTGLIWYSTGTELLPPGQSNGTELNDCYHRWFAHTEMAFQTSDPAVLAGEPAEQMKFFNENLRPCLEHIEVAVPDDLEYQDENWGPLNDEAVRAINDGRCVGA